MDCLRSVHFRIYINNCFDKVPGNERCLASHSFWSFVKIMHFNSTWYAFAKNQYIFLFFCYCVTVRFITCEFWYFVKYRLIFWMGINYERRPLFRNVFCWKLLTVLLKSTWKSLLSMLSISLLRSGHLDYCS